MSVVPFISQAGRLILLATVVFPKCYGRSWARTREVYMEYTRLSAVADVKPVTYRQFTTIIKQLVEMGVIERSVWSVGRYGKVSVLRVKEPERVWMELKEDLALGEVAERICSKLPPSPPSEGMSMLDEITRIADKYNALGHGMRVLILVILLARGRRSWDELKREIEALIGDPIDRNTLSFHLERLIQSGLVVTTGSAEHPEYQVALEREHEIPEEIRRVAELGRHALGGGYGGV